MSRRRKSFFGGLAISFIAVPINIVLGILCTPIYFRYISNEEFGLWSTVLNFFTLLQMINAGVGVYLVQTITNKTEQKELNSQKIKTNFVYQISVMLLASSVSCLLLFPVKFFGLIDLNSRGEVLYLMMGVFLGVNFVFSWFTAYVSGQNNMTLVSLIELLQKIAYQSFPIVGFLLGYGILSFPISYLITIVFLAVLILFTARIDFNFISNKIDNLELKKLLRFNYHSLMGSIGYYVLNFTDTIIIASVLNNFLVTVYVITFKLNNFLRFIPLKLISNSTSTLSELYHEGNFDRLREIVLKLFRMSFRIGLFLSCFIIFMNKSFVVNWVGADKYGGDYLSILAAIISLKYAVVGIWEALININKDIKRFNQILLFEAFLNLGLSLLLVNYYKLLGVAGATISALILSFYYCLHKSTNILKVKKLFFLKPIIEILFKSLPSILVLIWSKDFLEENFSWFLFLILNGIACFINILIFEGITAWKLRRQGVKHILSQLI